MVVWFQKEIILAGKPRGFHLITDEILSQIPEIKEISLGLIHIFIKHTSASLAVNENADPTVRADLEAHFKKLAPDNEPHYVHTYEGPDDMPAHIKAILLGSSVTLPLIDGRINVGTWQGIYLCEHRVRGGRRRVVVTLNGQRR